MDANELLNTIRTMIESNQTVMYGPQPDRNVAEGLGMEVIPLGGNFAWTIANEKRPEYMQLSPSAYLASDRRMGTRVAQQVVSRNVYLRYMFRRERNRALAAASPEQKSGEGWYPWLRSAS